MHQRRSSVQGRAVTRAQPAQPAQPCDCCGVPAPVLEILDNADMEPWAVCAACLRDACVDEHRVHEESDRQRV